MLQECEALLHSISYFAFEGEYNLAYYIYLKIFFNCILYKQNQSCDNDSLLADSNLINSVAQAHSTGPVSAATPAPSAPCATNTTAAAAARLWWSGGGVTPAPRPPLDSAARAAAAATVTTRARTTSSATRDHSQPIILKAKPDPAVKKRPPSAVLAFRPYMSKYGLSIFKDDNKLYKILRRIKIRKKQKLINMP
jgi:hypothetical protein